MAEIRELQKMGFIFDRAAYLRQRYMLLYKIYRNLYPDKKRVTQTFKVPHESPWPRDFWGKSFGNAFSYHISSGFLYRYRKRLNFALTGAPFVAYDTGTLALTAFKSIYNHNYVPYRYVVPNEKSDVFPPETRGFKLGKFYVYVVKRTDPRAIKYREHLKELGFDVCPKILASMKLFFTAVRAFRNIYGTLNIPRRFVVPIGPTSKFPIEVHGMNLGMKFYFHFIQKSKVFRDHYYMLKEYGISEVEAEAVLKKRKQKKKPVLISTPSATKEIASNEDVAVSIGPELKE